MNPQNSLLDESGPLGLPQAPVDETAINELKSKARYSRSKEYQELKAQMETRIEFYQKYLPNGTPIATLSTQEALRNWPLANIVIAELQQVINLYQDAEEQLKEIAEELV